VGIGQPPGPVQEKFGLGVDLGRARSSLLGTSSQFTEADRDWVRTHAATSLSEIETGTWRKLALRETCNVARAAEFLGIGYTSLGEWFARRRVQPSARREADDSLAQTRQILRSNLALRQSLRRSR
jgi:hypothetical protein